MFAPHFHFDTYPIDFIQQCLHLFLTPKSTQNPPKSPATIKIIQVPQPRTSPSQDGQRL